MTLAFPGTDYDIAVHWVDIFGWLQENLEQDSSSCCCCVRAQVDKIEGVPVVHLSNMMAGEKESSTGVTTTSDRVVVDGVNHHQDDDGQ